MSHVVTSAKHRRTAATTLGIALAVFGACSSSQDSAKNGPKPAPPTSAPPDAGASSPAPGVGLDAVPVGSCGAPASPDVYVSAFVLSDCQAPHAMEVAGRYALTDAAYPGNTRLHLDSYRDCQPIFEKYVGVPFWDSRFDLQTITPSPSTWARGDRTVTCLVVGEDGAALPTSARGARR